MPICRVDVLCGNIFKNCTLYFALQSVCLQRNRRDNDFFVILFCLKNPCMTCALCRSLNICLTLYTIFTTVSTFLRQTAELKRIICLHNLCGKFANCPCISVKTNLPCKLPCGCANQKKAYQILCQCAVIHGNLCENTGNTQYIQFHKQGKPSATTLSSPLSTVYVPSPT